MCGAETRFKLITEGLPSGLRRGLDRIGINNLGKGHADITASAAAKQEKDDVREGAPIPFLSYSAALPYAEMRMRLGGKKAVVSAVGKRCAITGVPNFLDGPLEPWRDKLRLAAQGKGRLEEALEARAINDVLSLFVAGKNRVQDVRRLYPFGLSAEVMTALLSDVHLALNRTTLKTRAVIAALCGLLCAALFYALFFAGVEARLTFGRARYVALAFDPTVLCAALGASWAILNFSTRFVLQRRFPQMQHALQQKIGKTGWAMLGGIAVVFIVFLWLAPVKPLWLGMFMR